MCLSISFCFLPAHAHQPGCGPKDAGAAQCAEGLVVTHGKKIQYFSMQYDVTKTGPGSVQIRHEPVWAERGRGHACICLPRRSLQRARNVYLQKCPCLVCTDGWLCLTRVCVLEQLRVGWWSDTIDGFHYLEGRDAKEPRRYFPAFIKPPRMNQPDSPEYK